MLAKIKEKSKVWYCFENTEVLNKNQEKNE